jgi:hypothetical protein
MFDVVIKVSNLEINSLSFLTQRRQDAKSLRVLSLRLGTFVGND